MVETGTTAAVDHNLQAGGTSPSVNLDHLSKLFPNGTQAVKDLTLHIKQGEVFTLLGPSGCGKTTTLRMVAGLESPNSGSIAFGDRAIVDTARGTFVPPERREIGMVFQSYAIWPHMTVEENIAYPLKLRKVPAKQIKEHVARVLELVGMPGMERRPAPMLSGGQQQRVALARALVYEPGILLLDEPFSNLDAKLREQMRVEVKLLQKQLQITVLFVTHDQIEALSLSDRIAVMNLGEVQQVGEPKDLYEQPANGFVRDFLGKTILLKGHVQTSNQEGQVAASVKGAEKCVLFGRNYLPEGISAGTDVYIAMRPEDIDLTPPTGPGDDMPPGVVAGRVEAVLFVGERTEYRVEVKDQGSMLVYGDRHEIFAEGADVWMKVHPNSVSVWPA